VNDEYWKRLDPFFPPSDGGLHGDIPDTPANRDFFSRLARKANDFAIEINYAGGICPYQAWGTAANYRWYLRARHGFVSLSISDLESDPVWGDLIDERDEESVFPGSAYGEIETVDYVRECISKHLYPERYVVGRDSTSYWNAGYSHALQDAIFELSKQPWSSESWQAHEERRACVDVLRRLVARHTR
jgi:hypothetical protein